MLFNHHVPNGPYFYCFNSDGLLQLLVVNLLPVEWVGYKSKIKPKRKERNKDRMIEKKKGMDESPTVTAHHPPPSDNVPLSPMIIFFSI